MLAAGAGSGAEARAADTTLIAPAHRLNPEEPGWRELAARFAQRADTRANFEEQRFFPFSKNATVLKGEVRVSRRHGLSLHYISPDERTLIFDDQGMLVRDPAGHAKPPPDPRGNAANEALRHILRFDFAALAPKFDLYGRQQGGTWSLALVPKAADVRRAIGNIFVTGEGDFVRTIELYRSARQHIDIAMSGATSTGDFPADETKRFFR
jgi:hypothetical protein